MRRDPERDVAVSGGKALNPRPEHVAATRIPVAYSAVGLDIGMDNISPVSPDYKSPFTFGGKILSVTIAVEK